MFRIATIAFCLAFLAQEAAAIPAFARKYDMSCNVCHSPAPKLKPFGEAFAANGFQLAGGEPPRFVRETGDAELLLMRELPLAFRLDAYARYQPKHSPESDMQWPFILKILSAGQIARDVSYFLYFLFNERGEIAGVEDAFVYFNNIGNIELDATIGQFQVADPIFKRELRPTFEDYEIYTIRPGLTKANLAYDRGLTLNYSLPTGTDLLVSVLNGNGIGAAADGFDSDPYKNFFFRLAQELDSTITIGALGYLGKERISNVVNDISMFGGDATVSVGKFELAAQYVYREDKDPYPLPVGAENIKSQGGFVQLTFSPEYDRSAWYLFLLYNHIDSDLAELKYRTMTGNFSYMLARNFRLMSEYSYDLDRKRHHLTFGFSTAF